jgi:hypothetical protein
MEERQFSMVLIAWSRRKLASGRGKIRRMADDARSGQQSIVTCIGIKEWIDQRIRDNRRMTF